VHLAARSEHFCAMLYGGMRESLCVKIEVKDVSYDVFLAMLEFLYTDSVSDISPSIAIPLMVASEQYLLDRLKSLCQDQIRKSISATCAAFATNADHRKTPPFLRLKM